MFRTLESDATVAKNDIPKAKEVWRWFKELLRNYFDLLKTSASIPIITCKDTKCLGTEFIYARVLGIIASSRETVSIETLFSHELAPLPTALFDETGDMRTPS